MDTKGTNGHVPDSGTIRSEKDQLDREKRGNSVETFKTLMEDTDLVPRGSALRDYLETLTREAGFQPKTQSTRALARSCA